MSSLDEVIFEDLVKKVVAEREKDTREMIARLIFKYNFEAIPVEDEQRRILGIVTAWDTRAYLLPKVWRE
jgi:CBS domain-containing protein